jgi:hypothetical protein
MLYCAMSIVQTLWLSVLELWNREPDSHIIVV